MDGKISLAAAVLEGAVALARLLDEHLDRLSFELLAELMVELTCALRQRRHALANHCPADELPGPAVGRGPGSWRKVKRVDVDEPGVVHDLEGALKLLHGLAGEARDHVGRESRAVKRVAHAVYHPDEIGPGVLTVHPAQDRIRSALKREMKMRHDLGERPQCGDELFVEVARFEAREAQ